MVEIQVQAADCRVPACYPAEVCPQYNQGQGIVVEHHYTGRYSEQVRQHGQGLLQAGDVSPLADGVSQTQPGVFAQRYADKESLCGWSKCLARRMRNLGSRLQLRKHCS